MALELARKAPVAIVSVDAASVYRYLDIGTAKASAAERAEVPHYMIDLIDPDDFYSAWRFRADLLSCLQEIHAKKLCPLLVGGSMFYFLALMTGMPGALASNPARQDARVLAHDRDNHQLHQLLRQFDAASAARIHPNDRFRVERSLERAILRERNISAPRLEKLPIRAFALAPLRRHSLDKAIGERLENFMKMGLVDEVCRLRERWHLNVRHPSMRLVAYRQVFEHLSGRYDATAMMHQAAHASIQLCKRQYTWMRSGRIAFEWYSQHEALRQRLDIAIDGYLCAREKDRA